MTQAPPRRFAAATSLLILLTLLAGAAPRAQEVPAGPSEEPSEIEPIVPEEVAPEGVESIEVVGEKLDVTDVQDEAQAISSFSMDDLDKLNISNVDGLAANVPGLHVGQVGQSAVITLRGIGTENASVTGESGVAFHVDGIYYGRPSAARVAFFDLEKLDVKRGPQGLLGGKNSTSGSINVVTNDPTDDYEVQGDVLFGNYDRVRARGVLNVPLGEYAAFRAAFFHENRDGYLDNKLLSDSGDPFDADAFGFRTKLRLSPTDSLDMIATFNFFQEKGNGPQADLVPILNTRACRRRNVVTVMPERVACERGSIGPDGIWDPAAIEDPDPREIFADNRSAQDNKYWGLHGKTFWDVPDLPLLGPTSLELRGGYQRTDNSFNSDFDGSSLTISNIDATNLTHEYSTDVRWSGAALGERLNWQTSLFFMRERGEATRRSPRFVTSDDGTSSAEVIVITNQATENKSYGAALHGELSLTDGLTFSLGGRWIKDRKESWLSRVVSGELEACDDVLGRISLPNGESGFPPAAACEEVFRGTMWGSRLEWRPGFSDDQLFYVGIDRGHKSGGFGLGGIGGYVPEKIWAYTVGSKSEFWDRRVQINLEGFFYAYRDMQIALIDSLEIRTENADTRMWGWELEATAEPIPGLTLRAVVGQLDTEVIEYDSLDPAQLTINQEARLGARDQAELNGEPFTDTDSFAGNQLSRSPEWKYTLSAEYEIPLGDLGFLTPRAQYTFQDDTYHRVFNRSFDLQEDHHLTNLKLLWRSLEGTWEAEVFVQNVEDEAVKQYILIGPPIIASPPLAWYNEPRFYGFRIGFRY